MSKHSHSLKTGKLKSDPALSSAEPVFDSARQDEILGIAGGLVKKYRYSNPPVDPEHIAEGEGVDVVYVQFKPRAGAGIHGFYDFEKSRIYVNREDPLPEKLFTIAHELGHHLLHKEYCRSEQYVARDASASANIYEKEADFFASHLLVPQDVLERSQDIIQGQKDKVAHFFAVPDEIAAQRLADSALGAKK